MTRNEIRDDLFSILDDVCEDFDAAKMEDDRPLGEQIAVDSMDFLDIVMALRKKYRINIQESDYLDLNTVKDTIELVIKKCGEKSK